MLALASGQPLFFTFLDGAFAYDCAACGQACCRGKGVALDASRELVPLTRRVPSLAPLLSPLPGGYVRLPDATDGCFFLRSDGMCSYEKQHGRPEKFLTCRLFPYNRIFRAGSVRVVDFNSVVCPLRDVHGSGTGTTHRELLDDIESGGDGPLVNSLAEMPDGARELRWHTLEQGLLDASRDHLEAPDYVAYAEFQAARGQRHLGGRGEGEESSFFEHYELLTRFYGIDRHDPFFVILAERTARSLTLLSPSLRFNSLFRRGAPAYRQHLPLLPGRLFSAFFLGTLAALGNLQSRGSTLDPSEAGFRSLVLQNALSLRALTELYQAHAPLRDLLARFPQKLVLDRPVTAPELSAELGRSVGAALGRLSRALVDNARNRRTLSELLLEAAEEHSLQPPERALLPALLLRAGDGLRPLS